MKKTATKSLQGATRSSMLQPSMATPISWQQSLRLRRNCYAVKTRKMKPLHIEAYEGHAEVVRVLLACIEDHNTNEKLTRMTDASGDTALHKAVRSQHLDVVKFLAKEDSEFEFPPNHAQETPLYLAAESGFRDALIIILESCKKQTYAAGPSNRTPLHAAVIQEHEDCIRSLWRWNKPLCEEPDLWGWNSLHYAVKLGLEAEILVKDLCSIGRFGKRDFEVKQKCEYMPNPNDETGEGDKMQLNDETGTGVKIQLKEDDQTEVESFMKSAQIHIVVATLIMTVTFTAGITFPGGFESDPDRPNQGMAILIRKTVFRAFVVSDAIAFTFSAIAIFIYFFMADESRPPPHLKIVEKLYDLAGGCPKKAFECKGSSLETMFADMGIWYQAK
ncbi:hypothetical protein CQW23_13098 [Capsicum baccatum]|uniref:PGG domain-containing protein n=1 Tax=Capsicum baccatum TaxID=33114 RepID=A0A2G2WUN1_CAPBA|nr:hypothetical protein CQW23_13098 [Capsicum baccatum]